MNTHLVHSPDIRVSQAVDSFIDTARVERTLTGESLPKYRASVACFIRTVGDLCLRDVGPDAFLDLKQTLAARNVGASYINGVIHAMKRLLHHCERHLHVPVADISGVHVMRVPRRTVVYLTNDELEQFISAIKTHNRSG
jgi:site-specific recombinase XerD